MSAVLEQEPLFAAVAGHMVTVEALPVAFLVELTAQQFVKRTQVWFTWACSCGETSDPDNRWSHPDLAEQMGVAHAGQVSA